MDLAESDLLFIDVDASMPVVKQEQDDVSDYNTNRSRYPSSPQLKILLERLEKNPELARGSLRSRPDRLKARRFWEQIRLRLNSMEGTRKSSNQWMKYWTDKKMFVKKKVVQGELKLTDIEEKIYYLGGGGSYRKPLRKAATVKTDSDDEVSQDDPKLVSKSSNYSQETISKRSTNHSLINRTPDPISTATTDINKCTNSKCQNQAETQFDRILRVEEHRLSMERSNSELMKTILQQSAQREQTILDAVTTLGERLNERNDRDALMAGALKTLGDGLLALSDAIKSNHRNTYL